MRVQNFSSMSTLSFPITQGMTVAVSEYSSKIFVTNVYGQLYMFNRWVRDIVGKPLKISIQHVLPDRQLPLGGGFTAMAVIDCSRTAPKAYAKVNQQLVVLNTDTGEMTKTIPYPDLEFWNPKFCPDGSKIYVPFSNSIKIFSAATDTEAGSPINVGTYLKNLIFSPDGKRLIGLGDHVSAIIEVATGKVVSEHRTSFGNGEVACISSDGKKIYVPTIDAPTQRPYISVVDSSNLKEVNKIGGGGGVTGGVFGGIASSPDHPYIAACNSNRLLVIDSRTDEVVEENVQSSDTLFMDIAIDKYLIAYANSDFRLVAARYYS